ncbi:MAG: aldo/keto reductase [Planctomycetota bacterium]
MRTMPLGRTGEEVSALCLGAMLFGTRTDEETSWKLLDRYVQAGGTFIDTANAYAHWVPGGRGGESEALLGRWMAERGNRDELLIATKVGFEYQGHDLGGCERGTSAEQIRTECEKSLKRLGVETIDLYYAHNDTRESSLEETLEAMDELQRAGKIRYAACSNYRAWRLGEALCVSGSRGFTQYVAVQQKHTYLRPQPGFDWSLWPPVNEDLTDFCRERNVQIVAYSPLLKGAYTREDKSIPPGYDWPDSQPRLQTLREVSEQLGATPNQVVLSWMLHSDPPILPLFSVSGMEQLEENLGALDVTLSSEQMQRLNEAGL